MIMNNKKEMKEWLLITIYDPRALPGKTIYEIIVLLLKLLDIKFVFLSDLEGVGVSNLIIKETTPLVEISVFLERIQLVDQFDWGDFFLLSSFPENLEVFEGTSYEDAISLTETTVRAVDDSYIYIYTPYYEVVELIEEKFQIEKIKKGTLDTLEYPF